VIESDGQTIGASADRLRRGETSAAALVDQSLAAIDQHRARTNAFTHVNAAAARTRARELDDELARGLDRGPLHGIPLSLKDLIDVAGEVTTAGSRVLDDRPATSDALIVTRLRDAGAVFIGRANLHEFALGTTSEDSAFGPVRNPADTSRVAGGSSGGSAVAVATGMGLASIGTDTGGSIRIPAAACGVVGLKAAHGDIPIDGVLPLSPTLDHVGPLCRSVQDAAWLWQVMAGRPTATVDRVPVRHLRLARLGGYFDRPLEPAVREAFDRAVDHLRRAGVTVLTVVLPSTDRIGQTYADIVLPEAAAWHAPYLDARADRYQPAVRARILPGREVTAVGYVEARTRCDAWRRDVDGLLAACDALVVPTLPMTAPDIGADTITIDPADSTPTAVRGAMLKHTQLFNLTGHPAISLPIASPGLPVGLQLVGPAGDTARLLSIASAVESQLHDAR
jgi:aspartyl-tRNA(Asn)/glutamyl-tRNA(Gln) amidotransferase subunit A